MFDKVLNAQLPFIAKVTQNKSFKLRVYNCFVMNQKCLFLCLLSVKLVTFNLYCGVYIQNKGLKLDDIFEIKDKQNTEVAIQG